MFSDSLKFHRKKANLSQQSLAGLLGVAQSTIAMWESGKNTPEYNSLIELATIFNTSIDSLVGNQFGLENTSANSTSSEEHFSIIIGDDSMSPRFMIGDLAIVKQCENYTSGDICLVQINNTTTVKKIIKNDFGIVLSSLNYVYDPQFYSSEDVDNLPISILGKVIELRATL